MLPLLLIQSREELFEGYRLLLELEHHALVVIVSIRRRLVFWSLALHFTSTCWILELLPVLRLYERRLISSCGEASRALWVVETYSRL